MRIKDLIKELKKHPRDYTIDIEFISENADNLEVLVDNGCGVVSIREF